MVCAPTLPLVKTAVQTVCKRRSLTLSVVVNHALWFHVIVHQTHWSPKSEYVSVPVKVNGHWVVSGDGKLTPTPLVMLQSNMTKCNTGVTLTNKIGFHGPHGLSQTTSALTNVFNTDTDVRPVTVSPAQLVPSSMVLMPLKNYVNVVVKTFK